MRLEYAAEIAGAPADAEAFFVAVGDAALAAEGLTGKYQAGLILTDDDGIRAVNRDHRAIDAATDVLSFPSVTYPGGTAGQHPNRLRRELDPETGCMSLGDIVISLPRAKEQAGAYGHSVMRELGFLFAHGMLHLMGYDHETDEERAQMRAMEETIMETTNLSRELTDEDFVLIEGAWEAMTRAYAPYSKYKVGACLRTVDGQIYKGCNVENASFGLSICAERNAMAHAVVEGMEKVEAMAIAADGPMPYPCGACRQFLREFAEDARVIVVNGDKVEVTSLKELLPESFGPDAMAEVNA